MRIGVLGGGQLGRMLALAGHPLGHTFTFIDPAPDAPMAAAARPITAPWADGAALDSLAEASDVITWEFENVSAGPLQRLLDSGVPVRPGPRSLEHKQDRHDEKLFFRSLGIPTAEFAAASTFEELEEALRSIGLPAVLKTRRHGYDGKGQAVIRTAADMAPAWAAVEGQPVIVEAMIPFERELSILAVRGLRGEERFYPLVENVHREGILRTSRAPFDAGELEKAADDYVRRIIEALEHVGVLALELFQVGDRLLANEMAPRVHNSGHWTIEGAVTSQFENHLRAITGAPLGSTEPRGHSVMINVIGTVPERNRVLQVPGAHLHLYGKQPKPRRKLGHVTICGATAEDVRNAEGSLPAGGE